MKSIIILFFISNYLLASSLELLSLYRTQGINAVQAKLEQQLSNKSYWEYYLQSKDVSNGYYESIEYLMVCQKDMKDIVLYNTKTNQKLFSSNVFTGQVDGDKQREGDLKTPVGVYSLKKRLTKLDPFYGPLALTTDYPNGYDKALGKTGYGIWIHGLPTNQKRDDYTKGCIALDNHKIKKLDSTINIDNSVLVISESKTIEASKTDIVNILTQIHLWKDAWVNNDFNNYIAFYSEDFKKTNGQSYENFKSYKERLFKKDTKKSIVFKEINIIPYPNPSKKRLFRVIMQEDYKARNHTFLGKKELYIEMNGENISIISES